jgi:hypothetical protein
MANETKIEAAAAVLEAMGGEAIEAPAAEAVKVAKVKKAVKAIKKAAKAIKKAKAKAKAPEAPKRPGPKTLPVAFPANTTHQMVDGGTLTVVKVRVSYLVQLNGGRLKWYGAKKMDAALVKAAAEAPAAEAEEAAA